MYVINKLTLFITETWLEPHGDESILCDLAPADYKVNLFSRESRCGGISVTYKYLSKRIYIYITVILLYQHVSFKVICLSLTSGNIRPFCLYRPPPCRNKQLTDTCFLREFHFLFDLCNTLSSSSNILSDLIYTLMYLLTP